MAIIDKDSDGYEDVSVTDRLIELITKMTDEEQEQLLKALERRKPKRREARKTAFIDVVFTVDGREFSGVAQDLSLGGIFIETSQEFDVGKEVSMEIPLSNASRSVRVKGRIARVEPGGIGVQFYK